MVGSGTVYLAPFGFPAVTSSGTVNGCAPTVIGCGTMIATTGTFTGKFLEMFVILLTLKRLGIYYRMW